MIRCAIVSISLMIWATASSAEPEDAFGKALVERIKSEGYRIELVRTTWLRRIEIESRNSLNRRETVYNPTTSVVLQDVIIPLDRESLMTKVSEMFDSDIRSGRQGRGDTGTSVTTVSGPGAGQGKSNGNSGDGNSGNGNSGNGNSGNGNSGNGNSGNGNSGKGNSGKGNSGKGNN
jgi:PPE-repeat protein